MAGLGVWWKNEHRLTSLQHDIGISSQEVSDISNPGVTVPRTGALNTNS